VLLVEPVRLALAIEALKKGQLLPFGIVPLVEPVRLTLAMMITCRSLLSELVPVLALLVIV
jgi:hypothetical protein